MTELRESERLPGVYHTRDDRFFASYGRKGTHDTLHSFVLQYLSEDGGKEFVKLYVADLAAAQEMIDQILDAEQAGEVKDYRIVSSHAVFFEGITFYSEPVGRAFVWKTMADGSMGGWEAEYIGVQGATVSVEPGAYAKLLDALEELRWNQGLRRVTA